MGKDLNDNELGKGIRQRKDGRYEARIRRNKIKHIDIYDRDLNNLYKKLSEIKEQLPKELFFYIPNIKIKELEENKNIKGSGGYVYFISDGEYVKIGVASNVNQRLNSLQTGNPKKLCLLHSEYTENPYLLEKEYHEKYKNKRLNGEWFDILDVY